MVRMFAIILFLASVAIGQATKPADDRLDFGTEGLTFPPAKIFNGHTDRTAQLLGEAYRRKEPLVWKRVQLVAELGQTGLPAASPYLIDAMKDDAPQVRAEAARSAGMIHEPSLAAPLNKLLSDPDPSVRREAVLASKAVTVGLNDKDESVIAAAMQSAESPADAKAIADALAKLPPSLQADAAAAMGRVKANAHASVVLPLLKGDVIQRAAGVKALGEMGDKSHAAAVKAMLADAHPTVRREAIAAYGKLAEPATVHASAIALLADPDSTVRESATKVLTPLPSTQAVAALIPQLEVDYAPLHRAVRTALSMPADANVRQASVDAAVLLLANAKPRRREDGSYVLGHLRIDAAIDQHIALLAFDAKDSTKTDWALVAQAAESLGLIGNAKASPALMALVAPAPESFPPPNQPHVRDMIRAASNAIAALGRIGHEPALAQARRILELNPDGCPADLRAASAFSYGMLAPAGGKASDASMMFAINESIYESSATKFEALKALGNLRHSPAAGRLQSIARQQPAIDLRWIAHWSWERCSGQKSAYTPPTERRTPPVSITDTTK